MTVVRPVATVCVPTANVGGPGPSGEAAGNRLSEARSKTAGGPIGAMPAQQTGRARAQGFPGGQSAKGRWPAISGAELLVSAAAPQVRRVLLRRAPTVQPETFE